MRSLSLAAAVLLGALACSAEGGGRGGGAGGSRGPGGAGGSPSPCTRSCETLCSHIWTDCRIADGRQPDPEEIPFCIASCSINLEVSGAAGVACADCLVAAECEVAGEECAAACDGWSWEAGAFQQPVNRCGIVGSDHCAALCDAVRVCVDLPPDGFHGCPGLCAGPTNPGLCAACVERVGCEVLFPTGSLSAAPEVCEVECG